jgi:putative redox protein
MTNITGTYLRDLRIDNLHVQSSTRLITDAPLDNQGKGESFSPTDLVGTALASCILTTMGIVAKRDSIDISGSTYSVEKEMANSPRRISRLTITFNLPESLDKDQRSKLEKISMACPVHHSLNPTIDISINYQYNLS